MKPVMQEEFWVNGAVAKASAKVKAGDIIEIQFGTKSVKAEVLDIVIQQRKKRQRSCSAICKSAVTVDK